MGVFATIHFLMVAANVLSLRLFSSVPILCSLAWTLLTNMLGTLGKYYDGRLYCYGS
ncbi:hypothetical protein APHNP_1663 [Anaplasma phagocytophilum str. ApNP]|uniref:Uncharacterized protein n=2 Tax=Anaplasma phagocytophilum TaxID=948 RepID=A0A0F3NFB2_ANAPH|nr:hypothetical protein APHMUC_0102 [Anaplasma phagocytophilum str. ApMUC09]KJV66720.1 hypothetical protein APHNP_1663 [Anaplasma phagocytophilum str. ApNP]